MIIFFTVVLVAYICWSIYYDPFYFIFALIGIFLSLFSVMGATYIFVPTLPFDHRLASISDTHSINGSFFLGSGTIDDIPSFMYYTDNDGVFSLHNASADKSVVKYTTGTPHVVERCEDFSHLPSFILYPFHGSGLDCNGASYTFYVPAGSVRSDFNLDAK